MTAGPPDGRTVARWRDQLAPLRPQGLWVGSLDLVHIDAAVRIRKSEPLDALYRLLLRAVEALGPVDLDRLDTRLGLGRPALYRWLAELQDAELVTNGYQYALTPAGIAALSANTATQHIVERRRFTFVLGVDGKPHYLPWNAKPGPIVPATAEVRWLTDCVNRPVLWKHRFGFPEDVIAVDRPGDLTGAAAWKRLAVARGDRPPVVLLLTNDEPTRHHGFAVGSGDPDLAHPALRLDAGWDEPFPELAGDPSVGGRLHFVAPV